MAEEEKPAPTKTLSLKERMALKKSQNKIEEFHMPTPVNPQPVPQIGIQPNNQIGT